MQALILVDIQNDFLPHGTLAVPNGDQVIPIANQLMSRYKLVVATQDWHPIDHLSFAIQHRGLSVGETTQVAGIQQILWPDHCIQNTKGAEFSSELNTQGINAVIRKGTDRLIDSYSGFYDNDHRQSTGLAELLKHHGVTGVDVMGLATDYCVKYTAIDAVELGFHTKLIVAGCRGVELTPGDCERAMAEMQQRGIALV